MDYRVFANLVFPVREYTDWDIPCLVKFRVVASAQLAQDIFAHLMASVVPKCWVCTRRIVFVFGLWVEIVVLSSLVAEYDFIFGWLEWRRVVQMALESVQVTHRRHCRIDNYVHY